MTGPRTACTPRIFWPRVSMARSLAAVVAEAFLDAIHLPFTYQRTHRRLSITKITALATGSRMVDMKYVGVSHGVFVNGTHVITRAPSKRYILMYSGTPTPLRSHLLKLRKHPKK
jgi:hypothetical protein